MSLCGFNKKMLEGLIAFHEGLVEHGLFERAKIRRQTVDQTFKREFDDMRRFLSETHRIEDSRIKELVEGLTIYASSVYRLVEREGIENYEQTVSALNKLYVEMDRKYYDELEGQPNDMIQLSQYLNKISMF